MMARKQGRMKAARHHKYGVSASAERTWHGRTYHSKAEMEYAKQLEFQRQVGEIIEYTEQPRGALGVPENEYRPDFFVVPTNEMPYYVDVKGKETQQFKKTKKLWARYGRLDLHVVRKQGKRFSTSEVVEGYA